MDIDHRFIFIFLFYVVGKEFSMIKKVKVVYVSKYDSFNNDATGEVIPGATKITFLDSELFSDDNCQGYEVNTMKLPLERFKELKEMKKPFDCEVEFSIKHDKVKYTDLII